MSPDQTDYQTDYREKDMRMQSALRTMLVALTCMVTTVASGNAPTANPAADPPTAPAVVQSTLASNDEQLGTALVLLEHIQSVLDEATVGKSGTISLDPGVVDQLRAEVAAVRLALRKERSQPWSRNWCGREAAPVRNYRAEQVAATIFTDSTCSR
jgi:hypothetical protein